MKTNDILITDFCDPRFKTAFQTYFEEMDFHIRDWDGLFREMNEDGKNRAWLRLDECEGVVGFIQFIPITFSSWFFEGKAGFIREFWIRKEFRGRGNGTALLSLAEQYFLEQGIRRFILTTATAPDFYRARGYEKDETITAKNKDDVFVKWVR